MDLKKRGRLLWNDSGQMVVRQLALLLLQRKRKLIVTAGIASLGLYAASKYVGSRDRGNAAHGTEREKKPPKGLDQTGPAATTQSNRKRSKTNGKSLSKLLPLLLKVAGRKIIVLLVLAIARTALSNRLARLQGYLFRAAFLRRVPLFARNLIENILLCGLAAGLEATSKSWVSYMELQWRRLLTSRLHSMYFDDMTYYKLNYVDKRIDSPEQRICEDIPKLSSGLAELTRELIVAAVDAAFYSWQLRRYSGTNSYTAALIAYVVGAGTFMTVAAPNFGGLFKRQATLEGSYRQMHARLRANAESIAFYGGIDKESDLLKTKFQQVVAHASKVLGKQWRFSMVQDFLLKYLGATVAVALIIGPFFGGHMRPEATVMGRAQMLSAMRYHTSVIISLFGALGTLGSSSRKFLKLGAYADRIDEMQKIMKEMASPSSSLSQEITDSDTVPGKLLPCDNAILFEKATVVTPGNATLVKELNLSVPAGTNLLVTGPNGAGKSSLFRVLGGLWPLHQGIIRKPGGDAAEGGLSHEIFYVPQRPYVTVGTLQDQLLYPLQPDTDHRIPEPELRQLLRSVDLEGLLDRPGGGEEVTNWSEMLSLGEQQRLGMARLFYHKPRFAILDECTSGVTVEMEERFCLMVRDLGCTCITISHRPALMAFHDVVLNLDGEGGWSLHEGHRALAAKGKTVYEKKTPSSLGDSGTDEKGKSRKDDVRQVLEKMSRGGDTKPELLADGNEGYAESILAKSQPADPSEKLQQPSVSALWTPRLSLQPSQTSPFARWRSILKVIIGNDLSDSIIRLSTVSSVVILRTLLQDRIASLNGRSVDLVLRQDLSGFLQLIGVSVAQSAASAILAPSLRHVADSLALTWRSRLTRAAASKYLTGKTFYTVAELSGMSDVDQRLTRDIERLTDDLAALIPTLIKPVVDVLWFSWQLWRLTGKRGMGILYLYAALGYGALQAATPDFAQLLKREYYLEGDFRNAHTRLRTHAESVAFFGGGPKEGQLISGAFQRLLNHLHSLITLRWAYGSADEFFSKQLPHSITWLLTLLYSLEQHGDFGSAAFQGALVHNIRYLASVVTQCFTAFGELLALPKRFAEISGGVNRVSELLEVIEKAKALERQYEKRITQSRTEDTQQIAFKQVDILTPSGKVLARRLSFQVDLGTSLLVTGPNGSGKTSLFRILAGLWPVPDGTIQCPEDSKSKIKGRGQRKSIFYVPQKPYTTIGSLREQVIYPLTVAHAKQLFGEESDPGGALDRALDELMAVVRLQYLVKREGGWDAMGEWGEMLSLGEQQRLGMARLFFHRPHFGVLDECTNATSVDVEDTLFAYASKLGITLITITQRTALVKYHARELRLVNGEGDWELREIKDVRSSQSS